MPCLKLTITLNAFRSITVGIGTYKVRLVLTIKKFLTIKKSIEKRVIHCFQSRKIDTVFKNLIFHSIYSSILSSNRTRNSATCRNLKDDPAKFCTYVAIINFLAWTRFLRYVSVHAIVANQRKKAGDVFEADWNWSDVAKQITGASDGFRVLRELSFSTRSEPQIRASIPKLILQITGNG